MIQIIFVQYKRYCHSRYIWYIYLKKYPIHQYLLMGQQVILDHHHMTHQNKLWQIKEILWHATTHPIRYRKHNLNRIQIQVFQILLYRIHMTHLKTSIIKEDDTRKKNSRVKNISIILSKSAQSLQPRYLQMRTNKKS